MTTERSEPISTDQLENARGGPLTGLRVVELASSRACFAGKLMAIRFELTQASLFSFWIE